MYLQNIVLQNLNINIKNVIRNEILYVPVGVFCQIKNNYTMPLSLHRFFPLTKLFILYFYIKKNFFLEMN